MELGWRAAQSLCTHVTALTFFENQKNPRQMSLEYRSWSCHFVSVIAPFAEPKRNGIRMFMGLSGRPQKNDRV